MPRITRKEGDTAESGSHSLKLRPYITTIYYIIKMNVHFYEFCEISEFNVFIFSEIKYLFLFSPVSIQRVFTKKCDIYTFTWSINNFVFVWN